LAGCRHRVALVAVLTACVTPGLSGQTLTVAGRAEVGFGTGSPRWGPGIRNSIVMSNNAPGFPHALLGMGEPLRVGIGRIEARWIWGRFQESDWFDPAASRDRRFITGLVATFAPDALEGLTLGLTRVFYVLVPDGGVPLGDYFAVFRGVRKKTFITPENPTGDDEHDQMISLFGRWVLAASGFEVYGERARNDHSFELRDFLLEPEHSQGSGSLESQLERGRATAAGLTVVG